MTVELFLQAILVPVLVAFVAAFTRQYFPLAIAAAFWAISLWVKGTTLEAMDSIALVITLNALLVFAMPKLKAIWLGLIQALLLALLSVWQVKNFAADLGWQSWLIQAAFLALILLFSIRVPMLATKRESVFIPDTMQLYWLIPIGSIAIVSPIAGSILIGQMAGLVAVFALAMWIYQRWLVTDERHLALFIATPTLFVAQMAWHYAEIPWTSLAIGLIGWLPLLWFRNRVAPWWLHLCIAAGLFAGLTGIELWLEWPEQSLY